MVTQMTRAEYEKKYGTTAVVDRPVSLVDTTVSPAKMTQAEYDIKYGMKIPIVPGQLKQTVFGNPTETIKGAGEEVQQAIVGEGRFTDKSAIERGFSAAGAGALAVPTVVADVIPGGRQALDTVSNIFEKGTELAGNIDFILADSATKLGLMTPKQRADYEVDRTEFVGTPVGLAIESGANMLKSSGDVANTILMAHGVANRAQSFVEKDAPAFAEEVRQAREQYKSSKQASLVSKTADEIYAVENKYVSGRKTNKYSKDGGIDSRERIAQSGVLKDSVNTDGLIQTQTKGGAIDQYKAMTTKPAEGVVRKLLEREGSKVSLKDVEKGLTEQVFASGLEGADLRTALNGVKKEVAGLRLKVDADGNIPTTLLHDAKINTTNNINFQTPPETATYRKAIARGYKTLTEKYSSEKVAKINAELAKYYEDIARLEALDGKRVVGGRLGKYSAQIAGNIVGGAVGNLFGGPIGMAIGTILGGETAGVIKGKSMAGTFNAVQDGSIPESAVLKEAVEKAESPRQALPAGNPNLRSQTTSGEIINLPAKSSSTVDKFNQLTAVEQKRIRDIVEVLVAEPDATLKLLEQNPILLPAQSNK